MRKKMRITVLMADRYEITKGAKIDFCFDKESQMYIASSEGRTFGIAKTMIHGEKEDMESLGTVFSGVVLKNEPLKKLMEVMVAAERGRR